MAEREEQLKKLTDVRKAAPKALSKDEIVARNKAALEARKAAAAAGKANENSRKLPEGWRRVESRSRPGEYVYENIHTEERQSWFPDEVAKEEASAALVAQSDDEAKKQRLKEKNLAALERRKAETTAKKAAEASIEPPAGWVRTESRSRPGEFVYENTVTGERQAWFPDKPALSEDEIKKQQLLEKNKKALEARKKLMEGKKSEEETKPLPAGWIRVESRSRPGEWVYENTLTEERQSWMPETAAEPPLPEGWRKVESRTYPGEFVYENVHTLERQAWRPDVVAPTTEVEKSAEERTKEQLADLAKARAPPSRNIVCKAKALYDYTADNRDEEIDLLEGDVIAVEYKAANGWWVGINTRTQRNGIFPGTYVEEMA